MEKKKEPMHEIVKRNYKRNAIFWNFLLVGYCIFVGTLFLSYLISIYTVYYSDCKGECEKNEDCQGPCLGQCLEDCHTEYEEYRHVIYTVRWVLLMVTVAITIPTVRFYLMFYKFVSPNGSGFPRELSKSYYLRETFDCNACSANTIIFAIIGLLAICVLIVGINMEMWILGIHKRYFYSWIPYLTDIAMFTVSGFGIWIFFRIPIKRDKPTFFEEV